MKIKKLFIITTVILIIILNFNFSFVFASEEEPPQLTAGSAILIDNKTNKILYSKNENEKMYPASTTKILTAILTLENCNLDDVVTASYDAVMSIPDGYSSANIQVGETLSVEQLLEVLLVHSANDAANVLAEYVGGSVESFVAMMNTKLNELNLNNSHFTNTFGLSDEDHYTTAYDLAKIMQYCLKNEDFRRISGKASCAIPVTNKYGTRSYRSTNDLLVANSSFYYPYVTTGKTGYTSQAKDCLVSSAFHNDLELICVVLGCDTNSSNRFIETKSLYEYGYSNYSLKNIINRNDVGFQFEVPNGTKNTRNLDLLANDNVLALINNSEINSTFEPNILLNDNIKAPIEEGQIVGKISYNIDGVDYSTDLIASHIVEESKLLQYVLYIGCVFVFLFIIYEIVFSRKKK